MANARELTLIKTEDGAFLLEGSQPGLELEFYDVDGEGGKATKISFAPWNQEYERVPGVVTATYWEGDTDSFWNALTAVLESAQVAVVPLPGHAAIYS
jgi:hypothetical protein